jgi:hypothetical protein
MSDSPEKPLRKEGSASQSPLPVRRQIVAVAIVGFGIILMVSLGLFIFLGLRSLLREGSATPTPADMTVSDPTTPASPLPDPSCETIVSSGDVEVAVPLPVSVTVGGQAFPVAPTGASEQGWRYPPDQTDAAAWACGTVINYVLSLEPTAENRTLLSNLRSGDEIKLRLSNGVGLSFRFTKREEVPAGDQSVFSQQRPRLTLIVEQESGNWQIATADYATETESVEAPAGDLAQVGQPVNVGDAQVTVVKGYTEQEESASTEDSMYYLVEFSVKNTGDSPLVAESFSAQLKDNIGNVYLISPIASAAGENGQLSGEIAPGASVQGTAGYLVPDPLVGPLTWTFNPRPTRDLKAEVRIPYESGEDAEGSAEPGMLDVTITDAFLDNAGNMLIIEGELLNTGGESITVDIDEISLTSSAGVSALISAAPQLPWTIPPDQMQIIELQYERPSASTALLELRGFSFEIDGL